MAKGIQKILNNFSFEKILITKLFILIFLFVSCSSSLEENTSYGIATRHYLATEVGENILKNGGNAMDAAIAVAYALAVVNPSAGNLGGGGFMLIYEAASNKTFAVDYREKAPVKATRDMYLNEAGDVIKGLSLNTIMSSATPGTVAGMNFVYENFSSMEIDKLISPSISLAREGFKLSSFQASNLNKYRDKFTRNEEAKKIFTLKNGLFKEGDILVQKDLADTIELILKKGPDEFYSGEIAQKISNYFLEKKGILSYEDLNNYKVRELDSICGNFMSFKVCSMPPPSSGGVAIIQMLNILSNFDLENIEHNSIEYITLLKKAMKSAFIDRSKFLGDPSFTKVPVERLTSNKYAKEVSDKIKQGISISESPIEIYESEETTHFSIVDKWGNAVSNTYTLNTAYGSGIVVRGTGILMNNEMDDFSSKPGTPNAYGLVGSEANKIEAKKAPLSSMSPVIVLKNKQVYLITGSPGGSTIITSVLQEILNILNFEMSLIESSQKNRIHYQWLPDIIFFENLNKEKIQALGIKNTLKQRKLGEIHSILIKDGLIEAYSDKRRPDGKAIAVQ